MAIIDESVEIKCAPDKVFDYVMDVKSWPKWHPNMPESEQTSPGKIGVGATCRGINRVMGQKMIWTSKVTKYEPNKAFDDIITSGASQINEHLTFTPVAGGTKFNLIYDMKPGGFLKLVSPLVTRNMRGQAKANLAALKSILEK